MTIETAVSKNKVAYIESWRGEFCKSDRLLGARLRRKSGGRRRHESAVTF